MMWRCRRNEEVETTTIENGLKVETRTSNNHLFRHGIISSPVALILVETPSSGDVPVCLCTYRLHGVGNKQGPELATRLAHCIGPLL
jgi:hypothetical protein